MQALTDTASALLFGPRLHVAKGLELLVHGSTEWQDISGALQGGKITRQMYATIHGQCTLELTRELAWGRDLVRPYMILSGPAGEVRYNLGVYGLLTPETTTGADPVVFAAQGYDLLHRLNRKVGKGYAVAGGGTYRAALLAAFVAAGFPASTVRIEGAAADGVVPAGGHDWPLVTVNPDPDDTREPVTWLRIINDLLRAINFRSVWADPDGLFRCEQYRPPAARAPELMLDADARPSIVRRGTTLTDDPWAAPNRWVFLWGNKPAGAPAADPDDGDYAVDNLTDGPTSQQARGLVYAEVYTYDAASLATLQSLGDRQVARDKARASRLKAATVPFPMAGHFDVFTYRDTELGGSRKVQAAAWTLPLDGGDTEWEWEAVG